MAGRKDNGEGSISPYKKNGKVVGYRASIQLGRDNNGKIIRKEFYGKTKKEAKDKLQAFKKEYLLGNVDVNNNMTFGDWYYMWVEEYQSKKKFKTYSRYEGIYRNHIKNSSIARVKLSDLKVMHLKRFYNQLEDDGVSLQTIKDINTRIKPALSEAERQGLIQKNVAKLVTLNQPDKKQEVKILSEEEQLKFLNYLEKSNHKHKMLFSFTLGTGLRLGEILGLKWQDINFKDSELKVQRTLQKVKKDGHWIQVEQSPKTINSIRTVPIPDELLKDLKKYKAKQSELILSLGDAYQNNDYVFCKDIGTPLDDKTPGRNLDTILKRLNIERIKFHALRHTYITRMFEAGVDAKVIAEIVGHSDVSTTLNIYTHVNKKKKSEAVSKINVLFSRKTEQN
ncbi:tyrosine-type recombinase/integrase [Intestinibacter sp.]|uniref:tyrosine-type recombinase/integrase n=1 Tax=Intestinibacter sp. TaxID=1965304 RepID=UPI002A754D99|nr:site-specific integrase [Intestinibacter sp.]MDY2736140.1 site-specific integrase [Intestinibacter sp.]